MAFLKGVPQTPVRSLFGFPKLSATGRRKTPNYQRKNHAISSESAAKKFSPDMSNNQRLLRSNSWFNSYGQIWEFGPACFMTVLQLKRAQFQNYERLQIISHYEFAILTFRRRLCYHMMACTWFVTKIYVCPFLVNAKTCKGVTFIK